MSIDKKIQQALANDAEQLDQLMLHDSSLIGRLTSTFKSKTGLWMRLMLLVGIVLTAIMLWSGYQFWIAQNADDRIFYAAIAIFTLIMQTAIKLWSFMEMNRLAITREIKRVEMLVVANQK